MDLYGMHEAINQQNLLSHDEVEANVAIQEHNNNVDKGNRKYK